MTGTREIVQKYMDNMVAGAFGDAFALFAPDATYRVTGNSAISGEMRGIDNINNRLGEIVGKYFKGLPKFTVHDVIVDGDRAAVTLSGTCEGATGIYDQTYVFVFRVKDGRITELVEYIDMLVVETALLGRKLTDA